MDIRRTVAEIASSECSCNFTEANVINGQFNCRNLMTEVVYSAEVVFSAISTFDFGASNFVVAITSWARRSSSLEVAGSTLTTDPTCPTQSDSLDSEECIPPPPTAALNAGEIAGIVIGGIAFLVIVVVVIIIILAIVIVVKRNTVSYSFR